MANKFFRESDLEKIIDFFGIRNQKVKAIEEMSELQKEVCKNISHEFDDKSLEEEIADVQIMLNQLCLICGFSKGDIEYYMNMKIKRTLEVIETLKEKKE